MQQPFSPSKRPAKFDLIDESESVIRPSYPFVSFPLSSMMRAPFRTLTTHHRDPYAQAQPTS